MNNNIEIASRISNNVGGDSDREVIAQDILDELNAKDLEHKNVLEEILDSLESMYQQYCQDGHQFMTAGEGASELLERYGRLKLDEVGRIKP